MQEMANAYKTSMKKPLRNRGYANVNVSLVNSSAKEDAELTSGSLTYYSNAEDLLRGENSDTQNLYATLEPDYCIPGTMYFLPKPNATIYGMRGVVSANAVSSPVSLVISFDSPKTFYGLTLVFAYNLQASVPAEFTIATDTGVSISETDNIDWIYYVPEIFDGVSTITITVQRMAFSDVRFMLTRIIFGTNFSFGNDDIISIELNEHLDPLSSERQTRDAVITISNDDGRYDLDNPKSLAHYVQIDQKVSVQFGYDTDMGGGTVPQWVPLTRLAMEGVTVNAGALMITAKDLNDSVLTAEAVPYNVYVNNTYASLANSIKSPHTYSADVAAVLSAHTTSRIPPKGMSQCDAMCLIANALGLNFVIKRDGTWDLVLSPMMRDDTDDFTYTEDDIMGDPAKSKPKRVKDIHVKYYPLVYSSSSATDQCDLGEVAYISGEVKRIDHESVFMSASTTPVVKDGAVGVGTVVLSTPYYTTVRFIATGNANLYQTQCTKYVWGEETYTLHVHDDGEDINWDNPLIDKLADAQELAQRIADYYNVLCEYDMETRGDPELDAGDVVTQENNYTDSDLVCITDIKTTFNGAFHGQVHTRRLR